MHHMIRPNRWQISSLNEGHKFHERQCFHEILVLILIIIKTWLSIHENKIVSQKLGFVKFISLENMYVYSNIYILIDWCRESSTNQI